MQREVYLTRWLNNLNPNIKRDQLSKNEIKSLFNLHQKYGSQWKLISQHLPGRTDNFLKNQFFSLLRKGMKKLCVCFKISESNINQVSFH